MNKIIQANHGFTISAENGKNVFTYEQEKYPTKALSVFIIVCAMIAPIFIFIFRVTSAPLALVVWVLFTILLFKLLKYFVNRTRTKQSFVVDKQGFHVDGKTYLREHVTALFIKAGKSEETNTVPMQSGIFIPVSSRASSMLAASTLNAAHAAGNFASSVARASRMNMITVNYRVYIRYGNKNIILAKGLTSDTAELILDKIIEVSDAYKK